MKKLRKNSSGQVLILSALAIALIILSVMVYVYQTSMSLSENRPNSLKSFLQNVKLESLNLVIGSLANISWGGSSDVLRYNLDRWGSFIESRYYLGECSFSFELCEDGLYSSGIRIF